MTEQSIHRLTVVDSRNHVRGVSSLRVLDVLAGRRGEGIKEREGENLEKLLEEGIHLFVGDYLHQLSQDMPLRGIISYIMENKIGHIVLTDQKGTIRGIVTGSCILNRLPLREYGIQISEIITPEVHTLTPERTIREAVEKLASHNIRRLPIVEGGEIKGLANAKTLLKEFTTPDLPSRTGFSEDDVDRAMGKTLESIRLKKPKTLREDNDVVSLLEEMREGDQRAFPILKEDRLKGIATPRDILCKLPSLMGIEEFLRLIQHEDM
ncbi:MAG: CBS domain-containing protein [Thermoproteota archaeon]